MELYICHGPIREHLWWIFVVNTPNVHGGFIDILFGGSIVGESNIRGLNLSRESYTHPNKNVKLLY
jgi:hypothetical protein